jgi:hypothetical protein
MSNPKVEIVYFEGCPNWQETMDLVERMAGELALEPTIRLFEVPNGVPHVGELPEPTARRLVEVPD